MPRKLALQLKPAKPRPAKPDTDRAVEAAKRRKAARELIEAQREGVTLPDPISDCELLTGSDVR